VIIPVDHAVTTGPIVGLEHPELLVKALEKSGVDEEIIEK